MCNESDANWAARTGRRQPAALTFSLKTLFLIPKRDFFPIQLHKARRSPFRRGSPRYDFLPPMSIGTFPTRTRLVATLSLVHYYKLFKSPLSRKKKVCPASTLPPFNHEQKTSHSLQVLTGYNPPLHLSPSPSHTKWVHLNPDGSSLDNVPGLPSPPPFSPNSSSCRIPPKL